MLSFVQLFSDGGAHQDHHMSSIGYAIIRWRREDGVWNRRLIVGCPWSCVTIIGSILVLGHRTGTWVNEKKMKENRSKRAKVPKVMTRMMTWATIVWTSGSIR